MAQLCVRVMVLQILGSNFKLNIAHFVVTVNVDVLDHWQIDWSKTDPFEYDNVIFV